MQVAQHFTAQFKLTPKNSKMLLEELADLAVTQTRKVGELTIPGIEKLSLSLRRFIG